VFIKKYLFLHLLLAEGFLTLVLFGSYYSLLPHSPSSSLKRQAKSGTHREKRKNKREVR
jgi:hypothetical protein